MLHVKLKLLALLKRYPCTHRDLHMSHRASHEIHANLNPILNTIWG